MKLEDCRKLIEKAEQYKSLREPPGLFMDEVIALANEYLNSQVALFMAMSWWQHLGDDNHPTQSDWYEGEQFCTCKDKGKYDQLLQEVEWDMCLNTLDDFEGCKKAVSTNKDNDNKTGI